MFHFQAAQPALLYLVPACILGTIIPALLRKQFIMLWRYEDEDVEKN